MVNASEVGAPVDDHVCQFDFQPGWVDLMLEKIDWVEAWAAATVVATTQFDSAELTVKTRTLIRELRSTHPTGGAWWISGSTRTSMRGSRGRRRPK